MKRSAFVLRVAPFLILPFFAAAQQPKRVELRCHRTANQDVPENTLESLEQAALLGCDVVEIDLRRTLDRKIVLNHDGFLERLTDGHGEVETTFYDDLRMRDAGAWMSVRFAGLRVPLFEDALRLARERHIRLVLDIKDKGIGAEVLAILRREDMLNRVEFGGEWDDVKKLYPRANDDQPPAQWVSPGIAAAEIQQIHAAGQQVIVNFSANPRDMDLAGMRAAVAAGADSINVDFARLGADAVGRPAENRIRTLLEQAGNGTSELRVQAVLELARYRGFSLQDNFARLMLDHDGSVSRAAALALVQSRPLPEPSAFTAALHSANTAPRVNAAWTLGVLRAAPATVLPLLHDPDASVVSEALVALAHMPGEVSAHVLLPLLHDPHSEVRGAAAVALAVHQPAGAAAAIPAQLRREAAAEQATYRHHALADGGAFTPAEIAVLVAGYRCEMQMLRALHMLHTPAATHELEAAAFGSDEQFPEPDGAVAALMLWDDLPSDSAGALTQLASSDGQSADRAEWALVNAGSAVLPAVRQALLSKDSALQLRAIHIVAWQADASSLNALGRIAASHGANAEASRWAIEKIAALHPTP